ncbi:MAG TPA: pyruvate kinase [Solirubrobacterales bacterium]|nr:pyruvate kinase [Solirubrobacterales bacterium]
MAAKTILCTLGPASLRPDVLKELDAREIDLFRINLSHTPLDAVESTIEFVRRYSSTPICIDTEGAQIRCGTMMPGVVVTTGQAIRLTSAERLGMADTLAVRPASVFDALQVGSILRVDFDGAQLRVTTVGDGEAEAIVIDDGHIGSNKAVTIDPPPRLPPFTDHDVGAIEVSVRHGIRDFALSFTNDAEDVARFRDVLPADAHVIAKIENRGGVQNVEGITSAADAVLIDRGDLSREVAIEYVPVYQKHIIRCANALNTPVFVATNLLESMVRNRVPTVAEANDIVNTLYDGAHGLVLAAETAIGEHPVQSVDMVLRILEAFERSTARPVLGEQADATRGPEAAAVNFGT